MNLSPHRDGSDLVLVVDRIPDKLAGLHDALDESGYDVLLATDDESALRHAQQASPDIVLLDAVMPGLGSLEVARRLKAHAHTSHIPIIFMGGQGETEHLVAAFEAGGVDYLTEPTRPREVLARMGVHLQGARLARQARNALDAFGYASIAVRPGDGRLMWQTPLARDLLQAYFATSAPQTPAPILDWLRLHLHDAQRQIEPPRLNVEQGARRLSIRLHRQTGDDDWLIVMREVSDGAIIASMSVALKLTLREAEVLYWVAKGKINRDIADILGASPATVKKHLERIFAKLGVETRTAAAAMAMNRIRQLHPEHEG